MDFVAPTRDGGHQFVFAAECWTTSPPTYNSQVIRTPVGEANVIQAMLASGATIGGEGNGGVIDPRIVPGRDSLVGMAYVLQLMAATELSISQLVAQIPRYEIVKTKFSCRREDAERAVAALRNALCFRENRRSGWYSRRFPPGVASRPAQQYRAHHAHYC